MEYRYLGTVHTYVPPPDGLEMVAPPCGDWFVQGLEITSFRREPPLSHHRPPLLSLYSPTCLFSAAAPRNDHLSAGDTLPESTNERPGGHRQAPSDDTRLGTWPRKAGDNSTSWPTPSTPLKRSSSLRGPTLNRRGERSPVSAAMHKSCDAYVSFTFPEEERGLLDAAKFD